MSEDKLNNHLTSESYLSLRKPSNEDDENFISGISSSYQWVIPSWDSSLVMFRVVTENV